MCVLSAQWAAQDWRLLLTEASSGLWSLLPPECVARKTAWATFHQSIRVKRETKGDIYTALVTGANERSAGGEDPTMRLRIGIPKPALECSNARQTRALFSVTL